MTERSDVLVIGGGIAGIGAGAMIAADASVRVLESEDAIGRHATGRSAAIFILNYGNATLRALNAASEPVFENPDGIADSTVLTPRGEMLVATHEELPDLESYLDGAEAIERLTAQEAVDLCPILRPEVIAGAAIERDARDIDVDRLFQGYARLLKARGGSVHCDAGVAAIERSNGVWRVTTAKGEFEAPILINAAGAWADKVAAMAGVTPVGLTPFRRSAAILPPPEGMDITRWPLIASASEQWYAKPEAGMLMVSPAEEDPVEPHDAWADEMVLAEGLFRFEQAVTMEVTRVVRNWAGLRTFAPDRTPVVGYDPEADGFFWLAGQGGYGIQTAPALSQLAADLCNGRTPSLAAETVAALSPRRFRAN
ncbi:NAD(P)/FAD-dependent oxidoreductase [Pacificispira sp.]|uniref:NAD(P)/FAD-dependent oxidoreductase n=1 Tax=Pacificispira sp. TaxID=2888761 RepID=UPI003B5216AB